VFIYYFYFKNYPKAAQAFEAGSKIPGAHPFMKIMAANMAQHSGDLAMARMLWMTTYETMDQPEIRANAVTHLRALKVDEDITELQKLVSTYEAKRGRLPSSFNAMIVAGLLRGVPADPDGKPYKLMPDGRIELRNPDDFPFIEKGMPPGYQAPPPKFR
jgi:hypothetical protein